MKKEKIKKFIYYMGILAFMGVLCPKYYFADGAYRIIIEESGEKKEIPCTQEELYAILRGEENPRISFKLLELLEEWGPFSEEE